MTTARRRPDEAELHAFVDDQLPETRRREIEAWLADNPRDAARVRSWQEQSALIRELFGSLEAEVPERLRQVVRRRSRPSRLRTLAASIALVLIGAAAGWTAATWIAPWRIAGGEAPVAEDGLRAYRVYVSEVRHPVEVGADEEAHLVAWLSKRLGYPLRVPDLRPLGFFLVGGRLLPDTNGNPAAQLMFEDGSGRRVTLFVARSLQPRQTSFRYVEQGDVAAFYWYDGEIGYALVGPLDRERLLSLSRAVYEQLGLAAGQG